MTSNTRRVVVTGIGLVTPLGGDRETSWRRLLAGERAARRLWPDDEGRLTPTAAPEGLAHGPWMGAPAADLPADELCADELSADEPVVALAQRAAREAVREAGLAGTYAPERAGCVIGTSKGGLLSARRVLRGDGASWNAFLPHAAATAIAAEQRLEGPLLGPVLACATGLAAIVRGAELIAHGDCDVVLAGSSDASLSDLVVGSFRRLGVHSRRWTEPESACRPFDAARDGFVVGEGAGVVVLETAERARARGVRPYAEWLGGRLAAEALNLTRVDESGATLARTIADLLTATGVATGDVDHVFLHGTGTGPNDRCESRAIEQVFGPPSRQPPSCSVKGAVGHLLGAAGSVETGFGLLGLRDGVVPGTANFERPDPDGPLNVSGSPRPQPQRHLLEVSLGFGGHVVAGLFREPG